MTSPHNGFYYPKFPSYQPSTFNYEDNFLYIHQLNSPANISKPEPEPSSSQPRMILLDSPKRDPLDHLQQSSSIVEEPLQPENSREQQELQQLLEMNHFSNSEMIIQDDIDMTSLDESMEMMSESSVSLCNTNNNTSFSGLSHVDITSKYTEIYLSTILTGIKKVRIKKIIFQIKCPTCQDPEIILKRESKTNKFISTSLHKSCIDCYGDVVIGEYSLKGNVKDVKIGYHRKDCQIQLFSIEFNKLCCENYTTGITNNMVCFGSDTVAKQHCHLCEIEQKMELQVRFVELKAETRPNQ